MEGMPMPRSNDRNRVIADNQAPKRAAWFLSADESAEYIADWDVKDEQIAALILGALGQGGAIRFGTSLAGDAVSVTIWQGEAKLQKWAGDSVEFDKLIWELLSKLPRRQNGKESAQQAAD
jgi:hypothetical protein